MIQCLRELQPITRTVFGAEAVLASCADEPSASLFGGMDLLL
jgi:disulfide oxidoreductase YuzD